MRKTKRLLIMTFCLMFLFIYGSNVSAIERDLFTDREYEELAEDIVFYLKHGRLPIKLHEEVPMPYVPPYEQLPKVSVKINGNTLISEISPVVWGQTAFVPLVPLAEAMDAKVGWKQNYQQQIVSMSKDNISVSTEVLCRFYTPFARITYENENTKHSHDEYVSLEHTAFIVKERAMVPLKLFTEPFGYSVLWDEGSSTVCINKLDKYETYMNEEEAIDSTIKLLDYDVVERSDYSVVDIAPDKNILYPPGSLIVLHDTVLSRDYYVIKKDKYNGLIFLLDRWYDTKSEEEIHAAIGR